MNAYLYRMPSGIPGDVTRKSQSVIEAVILGATAFTAFGVLGKISAGKLVPFGSGDKDGDEYGILVRAYPTTSSQDPLGTSTPPTKGAVDVLKRGYITVKVNAGTAALGSQVYVRIANAGVGKPIGGIEAVGEVVGTAGTNTGNGTIGTLSQTYGASGTWLITMLTATTFSVVTPAGARMKDGATGVAYSAGGIGFTITAGGTAFVAGDSFSVAVNTVALSNTKFTHPADASGNAEIAYKI